MSLKLYSQYNSKMVHTIFSAYAVEKVEDTSSYQCLSKKRLYHFQRCPVTERFYIPCPNEKIFNIKVDSFYRLP